MNPMAFFASMNNHMASGAAGSAFNNGSSSDQKPATNFVPVPVPFPVNHQNAASTNPPGNNFSPQGSGNSQFMGTGNMTSPPQQQSNWMNQQLQRTMTMNPHQVQQLLATIDTESLQAALLARAMLDQQRRMGVPAPAPYMQQQQRGGPQQQNHLRMSSGNSGSGGQGSIDANLVAAMHAQQNFNNQGSGN